jgi:hypothetical protein
LAAPPRGFDPGRDLEHIGFANQTTMLMSESLEIGEMLKAAMLNATERSRWIRTSRRLTRSAAPPDRKTLWSCCS